MSCVDYSFFILVKMTYAACKLQKNHFWMESTGTHLISSAHNITMNIERAQNSQYIT